MPANDNLLQLNHEAWQTLARGKRDGWDIAAENTIKLVETEDTPERAAKIEFVSAFAGKVASHTDELVVFHYSNEEFTQFHAIVPDPEEPFELCAASSKHETPFIYVQNREKSIGQYLYSTMAGARDIAFSNVDPNPAIQVYMGPGVRPENRSPQLAFDSTYDTAVGSTEVAELFASLRSETNTMYNTRLFGALFHVALLADDFEVQIPRVTALNEEAALSLIALENERTLSDTVISIARFNKINLKKLVESYQAQSVVAQDLYAEAREAGKESAIPTMYRTRTNTPHELEEISKQMGRVQERINSLATDELERRIALDRQQRIISAITGLSE